MDDILDILKGFGPLTGRELLEKSHKDPFSLWQESNTSPSLASHIIGKRYLRLDRRIEGYARLSPSILREFLTYTVIGLHEDLVSIGTKAKKTLKKIQDISKEKLLLSQEIIKNIVLSQKDSDQIAKKAVFIIAGDVVYDMAHDEPRPETSTGQIIKGSDLDIIIVTEGLDQKIIDDLDNAIYSQKYSLIKMPAYREEIDYIIKDIKRVQEQIRFTNFEFMVASKILEEGVYLFGDRQLFEKIKKMLVRKGVTRKLQDLESRAIRLREEAKKHLLEASCPLENDKYQLLFYTKEETEEIF